MDLAEDDQERIYRLLEWRTLARISVAGSPSYEGMSAHEQQATSEVPQGIVGAVVRWLRGDAVELVDVLPSCELHQGETVPAAYDALTVGGPWTYLCADCWAEHRAHDFLSSTVGRRLVVRGAAQ